MTTIRKAQYNVSESVQIFFTDTGPPPNSNDYTTLVIIHGSSFTGATFDSLHDHVHERNMRAVALNRREYPGSTPYTPSELEELHQGRQSFLDQHALFVGRFLRNLIQEENIPQISRDGKSGGIAVMGWSMGCVTAMTLFSNPDVFDEGLYDLLQNYVKGLVLYDPPEIAFGYDIPTKVSDETSLYHPWSEPVSNATPAEEYRTKFLFWIASFYDHDLSTVSSEWQNLSGFDGRKRSERCLADPWSDEYLHKYADYGAAGRSEPPMYSTSMKSAVRDMVNKALFDETLARSFFPQLRVAYMWASCSTWTCLWTWKEIERLNKECTDKGMAVRPIKFLKIENANHFAHLVDPPRFLELVAEGISS
ncbi:hypothetical protein V5O48_015701 [Marasmius crinis-equi]|uniref:AB hydrolase-1 domain-containing protein n=1 Tax=Marasmius crinis-equi TaxID=585013 RepID=A0ABR3ETS7_9AGAR